MWSRFLNWYIKPQRMLKHVPASGEIPPTNELLNRTMRIVWPAIMESVLIGLVGIVDTMMVSTLGTVAISAVGLTTQPKYIGLCVFFGLNVAVSALVARRRGEDDKDSANRILKQSLLITIVCTVLISVAFVVFASPIISICGSAADTHEYAVEYLQIIMGGLVFNSLSMVINAAQRGIGNTKIAMRTNMVSNLINIVLNYLLIGGKFGFPALGIRGAAIATVIGSIAGCVMSFASVLHIEGYLYLGGREGYHFDRRTLNSVAKISSGALAEQLFLRFGFFVFSLIVARLGTRDFAVHQICMNVLNFTFFFGDGLSTAAVTLVGQSLGQKRADLARIFGGICQRLGFLISLALFTILIVFAPQIVGCFSSDPEIIRDGSQILYLITYIVLLQIAMVVYCGCLRGAGDIRFVALIGLISVSIVRPAISWLLCWPLGGGLFGAWIGLSCEQTVRYLLSFLRFRSGKWTQIDI